MYDYQGAIKAGANPNDVITYLAKQTGYNAAGAIKAGAKQNDVLAYMAKLPAKQTQATPEPTLFQNNGVGGNVLDALTSSEQNAGKDISATISQNFPGVQAAQNKAIASSADLQRMQSLLIQKQHELKAQGKDTSQLDAVIADNNEKLGTGGASNASEVIPKSAQRTTGQVLGDFGGVALDAATAGSYSSEAKTGQLLTKGAEAANIAADTSKTLSTGEKLLNTAKTTAKAVGTGAAIGYGYDVTQNLQSGKTGASAFAPGAGTAFGAALPAAFGLYEAGKIGVADLGQRIDNSLIKPLPKQFRYGANPGRTMAELGVTGNSFDELATNLKKSSNQIGSQLQQTAAQLQKKTSGLTLDLTKELSPLDEAMQKAAANNDTTVLQRLQNVKKAIMEELTAKVDSEGNAVVVSNGPRNLTTATFQDAIDTKRRIGSLTKFTGNASDDKAVNMALKQVYGRINDVTQTLADKTDSTLGSQWDKLNQQYADLQTASIATQHRAELIKGQNLVSLGQGVRGAGAVATAFLTGGPVAGVLAGLSEVALEKAFSSPAVKTRAAAWFARQSPSFLNKLYSQNPALRGVLTKLVAKQSN